MFPGDDHIKSLDGNVAVSGIQFVYIDIYDGPVCPRIVVVVVVWR